MCLSINCRRRSGGALRNHEKDAYHNWKRWAIGITCSILTLCLVVWYVKYLSLHFHERRDAYYVDLVKNQTTGRELMDGSCKNKPLDYKTPLLDCVTARSLSEIDPVNKAFSLAMDHLVEDHLSLLSLLGGCHDGICNSLLWKFGDKILYHYQFTVTVVTIVFCVMVALALWIYIHCYCARKEKVRVERIARNEPATRAKERLFNALRDGQVVRDAIQQGNPKAAQGWMLQTEQAFRLFEEANKAKAMQEVTLDPHLAKREIDLQPDDKPAALPMPAQRTGFHQIEL